MNAAVISQTPLKVGLLGVRAGQWATQLSATSSLAHWSLTVLNSPAGAAEPWLDAVLIMADAVEPTRARLAVISPQAAALVVTAPGVTPSATDIAGWIGLGVQDVITTEDLLCPSLPVRMLAAIERKRHAENARTLYATDLGTGLPHRQQLIEHMGHLLALREREPAAMAVLVMRVDGLHHAEAKWGREAAQVLRRKIAVRLRAVVRASDVVATLSNELYAVLLSSIVKTHDAEQVGQKLIAALHTPFRVAGTDVNIGIALGVARVPEDGEQPDQLLAWATQRANAATPAMRAVPSSANEPSAANDN